FHLANLYAAFTVMYFKGVHKRQRPSHICPVLMPPFPVPGHASYPSGHMTQGRLIARCAGAVLPANIQAVMPQNLYALADRIGRNREIAGFHYRTDTDAGRNLADAIFNMLQADRQLQPANRIAKGYADTFAAAQGEWA